MGSQIVAAFCLWDDILKALYHRADRQFWINEAEIVTIALTAALHFGRNQAKANRLLYEHAYLKSPKKPRSACPAMLERLAIDAPDCSTMP